MGKEGKNKPIISLTDYLILKCLSTEGNLVGSSISKKIKVSSNKVGNRLKYLENIKIIKRERKDKGRGIINFIEDKNKKIVDDFLKILKFKQKKTN